MKIFEKEYSDESLTDLQEDLYWTLNQETKGIPSDEFGFLKGTFKVTVEWEENENHQQIQ